MSAAPTVPVLIAVAPNGARKGRADHARLPITPAELAACADDCARAGAALLHLHVRDDAGRHSLAPEHYRAAIAAVRARVGDDLLLQVTSEAGDRYGAAEQIACIDALAPDAVSVAVRELFATGADPAAARAFLARLHARGALVQYILYDAGDLAQTITLHADGAIPQPSPHVLFVLGAYRDRRAGHPGDLLPLLAAIPEPWCWSTCAFGGGELRCVIAGALLGGHVRVGFENNQALPDGEEAPDNAALVACASRTLAMLGMRPASPAEARRLFT